MKRLPDIAIKECERELRAACRLPIDQAAIDLVADWLRPNFERILAHPEGGKRWADHGQRMRDNARHLGGFADFFASHTGADSVGVEDLKRAFQVIRADCTVRAEVQPVAYEYCRSVPVDARQAADTRQAEEFLHAFAPVREPVV
jgi:hypothetical protein